MNIKTLTIRNFKSFENVTIHFNNKINIFTGVNNSGKTTVLEALALWNECFRKLIRQAGKAVNDKDTKEKMYKMGDFILGTKNPNYIPFQEITSIRSTDVKDIFRNLDSARSNDIILSAELCTENEEIEITFRIIAASGQVYNIIHENYNEFDFEKFKHFFKKLPYSINLIYASPVATLSAFEEFERPAKIKYLSGSRASMSVLRNRIFNLRKDSIEFNNFLNDLSYVLYNKEKTVSITTMSDELLDMRIKLNLSTVPNSTGVDISLFGSGTLQIIEILLSLYSDKSDLNIVLLDEPDSHIHRDIQMRLLNKIENFTNNSQVFLTTHNETLIRSAAPHYLFHLQEKSKADYRNIMSSETTIKVKKGLQPSPYHNIVSSFGSGNSLDFINALECDKLILVEGEADANYIQTLLKPKLGSTKYMYWVIEGIDTMFKTIAAYQEVFSLIKNDKSLWEKAVLIFDKDYMTEKQAGLLSSTISKKFNIKTNIWNAYTLESTVLSDLAKFSDLVSRYFIRNGFVVSKEEIRTRLPLILSKLIEKIKLEKAQNEQYINKCAKHLNSRRELIEKNWDKEFRIVFEAEIDIKGAIAKYFTSVCVEEKIYQLADKQDLEFVINELAKGSGLIFNVEKDFRNLMAEVDKSNWQDEWNFLLSI